MNRPVRRFEDLIAWQKAQIIAVYIYQNFTDCKDYGFRNQICNAAVSISNNIAEGFDRSTDNQFLQFLDYAKASCGEVKSMIYLASKLNFISDEKSSDLLKSCDEESRILYALMQKIRNDKTVQ